MANKMSHTKSQRIAYWVVLISFAAPLLYYLIQMVAGTFDTVNLPVSYTHLTLPTTERV